MINLSDSMKSLILKCNYMDTVQGTLLSNSIAMLINKTRLRFLNPIRMMIISGDYLTLLADASEIIFAIEQFFYHKDLFNVGTFVGKTVKMAIQITMIVEENN
jgi:hypothetical protein